MPNKKLDFSSCAISYKYLVLQIKSHIIIELYIPHLRYFDAKNIRQVWTKNEVQGSKYGASDNGWINTDHFKSWFYELFLPNAIKDRPLLLLLDGHNTHYQPDIINVAKEHNVIVLC